MGGGGNLILKSYALHRLDTVPGAAPPGIDREQRECGAGSNGSWGTQLSQKMPGPRGVTPSFLAGGGGREPATRQATPARSSASGQPGRSPALTCVWSGLRQRRRPEGPERPPGSGARGATATLGPDTVHRAGSSEVEEELLAPRLVTQPHSGCPSNRGRDGERDPG